MFKILKKKELAKNIYLMDVHAPRVAASAHPGQFVIVRVDERGERVPLTICDYDTKEGSVTIVVQVVGASSQRICALEEGEGLADFVGPLGNPSEFVYENIEELKHKKIIFIAGGLGTAPVYPQVKWLKEHGIEADVIIGAKNKDLLILQDEMKAVAGELYIATDDGSEGFKGMVTDCLRDLIDNREKHYDLVIAIGPMIMMKFVALTTKEYGIKTIVSLNSLMVDGTGMCGACRVTVGGKTYFTCVDGPEFDAHEVDFDEAMRRQAQYKTIESRKAKMEAEKAAGHHCRVGLDR
ncbi:MAG TPA: sulfide/dihydroorotate dehydrogenase-like FAD/NAD-binding protein [Candidatus Avirikenella pullistercoris]|nr:sulfide/dihydroorotate dehydrogenase-like FAD/NAD-binding protein [Candidatus Avirikenella pullistercoris]